MGYLQFDVKPLDGLTFAPNHSIGTTYGCAQFTLWPHGRDRFEFETNRESAEEGFWKARNRIVEYPLYSRVKVEFSRRNVLFDGSNRNLIQILSWYQS